MIAEKTKVDCKNYFSLIQNNILNVLVYFETFNHPLRLEEIQNNCSNSYELGKLDKAVDDLIASNLVFEFQGYYSLQSTIQKQVENRLEKEFYANKFFEKSDFYIRIIKSMPFVRAVAISGSMSKGVAHEGGDIDYFIITEKNKLWLARTLLILFKKIFLFNSRRYFCVNYFLDINNLIVPDKNIFTATEIAYLIPVYNADLVESFKSSNSWIKAHYPHFEHPIKRNQYEGNSFLKRGLEFLIFGKLATILDKVFMKLTIKRWDRKFADFDRDKFELTMRSQKGVSKHHPRDFQNKVLNRISETKARLYPSIQTKL